MIWIATYFSTKCGANPLGGFIENVFIFLTMDGGAT